MASRTPFILAALLNVVVAALVLCGIVFSSPAERAEAGPSACLLYTSPSPRDRQKSRMPSSA